jgi:hypothetical protein
MMNDRRVPGQVEDDGPGLCAECTHLQTVISARGSRFYLCRMSFVDPSFPRYPPIPVITCRGFSPADPETGMR